MGTSKFSKIMSLVLSVVMLFSIANIMAEGSFPFVGYTKKRVELRSDSSLTSSLVMEIPSNSSIAITDEHGDFYTAIYEGKSGYVLKSDISTDSNPNLAEPTAAPASEKASLSYVNLKLGDKGESVAALQNALIELGFLKGKADGKYGNATKKAVLAFQKANKLPENGEADVETQAFLFEKQVKNAKGKLVIVKALSSTNADLTIQIGNYGDKVKAIQERLKALGYYKDKVDGKYGKGTANAVRAFQKKNKLKVDGKVGKKTLSVLESDYAIAKNGKSNKPKDNTTETDPNNNTDNTQIQNNSQSTDTKPKKAVFPFETITTDSVNLRRGASTRSTRIATVPANATITVDKISGDFLKIRYGKLSGYILSKYASIPDAYLPGKDFQSSSKAQQKYELLNQGMSGSKVKALQEALYELGFYRGTFDGEFSSNLSEAVKLFQGVNGYKKTGVVLPEMQELIYEKRPKNSKKRPVSVSVLAPVDGVVASFGKRGDKVRTLQEALLSLGYYKSSVSGVFDKATEKALKEYQKAHSIKQTGKLDEFTLLSLRTVLEKLQNKGGNSGSEGVNEYNVVVMRKGTRGDAVTRLQLRLNQLGYYHSAIDGVYGDAAIEAVKAFQNVNGLSETGVADLQTQLKIYSSDAKTSDKKPPENWQKPGDDVETKPETNQLLKIGSTGDAVKALQTRLVELNYLKGTADGIYGTETAKAVAAFQKANGLARDGVVGENTLSALYGSEARKGGNGSAGTDSNQNKPSRTIGLGTHGEDVKKLQTRLKELNYFSGAIDGIFGPNTELALRSFQQKNKLKVDGRAGSLTWTKLLSSDSIGAGGLPLPNNGSNSQQGQNNQQGQNGNQNQSPVFRAPKASEVKNEPWFSKVRAHLRRYPNIVIYDFQTGIHYNVHIFSFGKHADGEPITKEDTEKMKKALGESNWTPRPVWAILSDGTVYMASTHSNGHGTDLNPSNGLQGHICVHFQRTMEEAEKTGPYAVSHQNSILAGWDLTKEMAR